MEFITGVNRKETLEISELISAAGKERPLR